MGLELITKGKSQHPPRIFIYGIEGIGKSTFGSLAPSPIFIPTEDGLDQIDCESFPLANCYDDVKDHLTSVLNEQHNYKTVVIDSLDWLERLIWDKVCKDYGAKSIEKVDGGFGKGYVIAVNYWRDILDILREIREKRGMIVVMIAHAASEKYTDPEGSSFNRFAPRLHKFASALICEWCDAVFLATRELGAARGQKSGGNRIIKTVTSPGLVAKNRYNLPEVLPLDFNTILTTISQGL